MFNANCKAQPGKIDSEIAQTGAKWGRGYVGSLAKISSSSPSSSRDEVKVKEKKEALTDRGTL